jgi:hypothetical protein
VAKKNSCSAEVLVKNLILGFKRFFRIGIQAFFIRPGFHGTTVFTGIGYKVEVD